MNALRGGPTALAVCLLASACSGEPVARPLPALAVDPQTVTLSGISSGAYMAVQYQVAHSADVAGAAVLAGGPWYCARGQLSFALDECVKGPRDAIDVDALIGAARAAAERGAIDSLEHLGDDRVWVFHGASDDVMNVGVSAALVDFYREFVPPEHLDFVATVPAAHLFPTLAAGGACNVTEAPHLGACDYDAAGVLLEALYGDLTARQPGATSGRLERFDQRPFREASGSAGIADSGFLFIPDGCDGRDAGCRLHVVLHGCRQGAEFVEDAFATLAGYNEWAASNSIVVLYPQARSTLSPLNPMGCWDWWGYDGEAYALKAGTQIQALHAMIERLKAPAD
jgi:poly(3-hydroxybutyrate) depolymerase